MKGNFLHARWNFDHNRNFPPQNFTARIDNDFPHTDWEMVTINLTSVIAVIEEALIEDFLCLFDYKSNLLLVQCHAVPIIIMSIALSNQTV